MFKNQVSWGKGSTSATTSVQQAPSPFFTGPSQHQQQPQLTVPSPFSAPSQLQLQRSAPSPFSALNNTGSNASGSFFGKASETQASSLFGGPPSSTCGRLFSGSSNNTTAFGAPSLLGTASAGIFANGSGSGAPPTAATSTSPFSGFSGNTVVETSSYKNVLQQQQQQLGGYAALEHQVGAVWQQTALGDGPRGTIASKQGGTTTAGITQTPKSLAAKYTDTWKFLVTGAKAGVWPYSSIGAAEGEPSLFIGLDLSIDEHRYLFYQQQPAVWPALEQRCEQEQLAHMTAFYTEVQRKATDEGISFDAVPPTAALFHSSISGMSAAYTAASTSAPTLCFPQQQQVLAERLPPLSDGSATNAVTGSTDAAQQQQQRLQQQPTQQQQHQAMVAAFGASSFEPGFIPDVAPLKEFC